MSVGIIWGFSELPRRATDGLIRLMSDVTVTIPALMVLIVIQSLLTQIELITMALLIALFAWPSPTRLIRAQVLSMRESGYVRMAKLSGASSFDIMFREMLPNLLPYLAASFIGNAAGAILAAIGGSVVVRNASDARRRFTPLGRRHARNVWWWGLYASGDYVYRTAAD
jgi:peptide/nickel transport system permease protein